MPAQPKLLVYDICDAKRLQKVHRIASQTMVAIQKSVFYAELSEDQARRLLDDLNQVIDITCDKISMFNVKGINAQQSLGPRFQDHGIFLQFESGLLH